jgi:hypothetical protein
MADEGAWDFDLPLGGNIRSAIGDSAIECVVFHDGLPLASVFSTSFRRLALSILGLCKYSSARLAIMGTIQHRDYVRSSTWHNLRTSRSP